MKYISFLFLSLLISSCSQKEQNQIQPEENIIEKEYELKSGTINPTTQLGDVAFEKSKLYSFSIVNNGNENLTGPAVVSGEGYSMLLQNCALVKPKASCSTKVLFNGKNISSGIKQGKIILDTVEFNLEVNHLENPAAPGGQIIESVSFSPSTLDFGSLQQKDSVLKNITITNTSTINLNKTVTVSAPYQKLSDTCSGVDLQPKKNCIVKVFLAGNSVPAGGTVSGTLSYGNLSSVVNLTANVISQATENQNANVVVLYNNQQYSSGSTIDLGILKRNLSFPLNIYFKNIGSYSSPLSIASFSSQASILNNGCSSLAVNSSCLVKANLIPSTGNNISLSYSIGAVNHVINFSLSVEDVVVTTYEAEFSSFGSCSASLPCDGSGFQSRTLSACKKMNNGIFNSYVAPSFCSSFNTVGYLQQPCSSPAGDKVLSISNGSKTVSCLAGSSDQIFKSVSCDLTFQQSGESCVPAVKKMISFESRSPTTQISSLCGIVSNKAAYCLGDTQYGADGRVGGSSNYVYGLDGTSPDKSVTSIVLATLGHCAIVETGGVKCWGFNDYGNLGIGNTIASNSSQTINFVSGINGLNAASKAVKLASASTALSSTCALMQDGGVKCWGRGPGTKNGNSSIVVDINSVPFNVALLDSNIVDIISSDGPVCTINNIGAVQCWGYLTGALSSQIVNYTNNSIYQAYRFSNYDGVARKAKSIFLKAGNICIIDSNDALDCHGFPGSSIDFDGSEPSKKVAKFLGAGYDHGGVCVKSQTNQSYCYLPAGATYSTIYGDSMSSIGVYNLNKTSVYPGYSLNEFSLLNSSYLTPNSIAITSSGAVYTSGAYFANNNGIALGIPQNTAYTIWRYHSQTAKVTVTPRLDLGSEIYQIDHADYGSGLLISKIPQLVQPFDGSTPAKTVKEFSSQISGGYCVINQENDLYCWGNSSYGISAVTPYKITIP